MRGHVPSGGGVAVVNLYCGICMVLFIYGTQLDGTRGLSASCTPTATAAPTGPVNAASGKGGIMLVEHHMCVCVGGEHHIRGGWDLLPMSHASLLNGYIYGMHT